MGGVLLASGGERAVQIALLYVDTFVPLTLGDRGLTKSSSEESTFYPLSLICIGRQGILIESRTASTALSFLLLLR